MEVFDILGETIKCCAPVRKAKERVLGRKGPWRGESSRESREAELCDFG